ncbi:MAG TPA: hypothetical protein VMB72_01845 [Acidimicrobiales bacterium]|nr:hypothetical protein [Acidimicrobiales bacterium]
MTAGPAPGRGDGGPRRASGRAAVAARLERWRPVVLPAAVLWALAAVASVGYLHPFDVHEYARYAHAALRPPLLHRLPDEYPAPALALFLLPLALPLPYAWGFAVVTAVALLVLVHVYGTGATATTAGAEGVGRGTVEDAAGWSTEGARRLLVYLTLGAVMVLAGRYDLFPVAAAFLAVRSARAGRFGAAWTWSALGCALKLFPAALWPVLVVAEWRASGRPPLRRLWWIVATAVAVGALPLVLDRGAVLTVLHYYLHRPTEIGSLSAGLSVLLDPGGTSWVVSYHSSNVVSGLAPVLGDVFALAAAAGAVATWWAQARGRLTLEAACLLTLTLAVLGGKVLSVQYVMWLMPLWALYRLRPAWLLAAAANLVVFPYAAAGAGVAHLPGTTYAVSLTLVYFARDVLLVAGTVGWLRAELAAGRPPPAPGRRRPDHRRRGPADDDTARHPSARHGAGAAGVRG